MTATPALTELVVPLATVVSIIVCLVYRDVPLKMATTMMEQIIRLPNLAHLPALLVILVLPSASLASLAFTSADLLAFPAILLSSTAPNAPTLHFARYATMAAMARHAPAVLLLSS